MSVAQYAPRLPPDKAPPADWHNRPDLFFFVGACLQANHSGCRIGSLASKLLQAKASLASVNSVPSVVKIDFDQAGIPHRIGRIMPR